VTTLIVDADSFAYAAAVGAETTVEWGPGQLSTSADTDEAIKDVSRKFRYLKKELDADKLVLAISDASENGWRRKIYPRYKAHRKERKPLALQAVREFLLSKGAYLRPTLEADDICGILATSKKLVPGPKIIVSIDKDLRTIPGRHFSPMKRDEGIVVVDEREAHRWHMMQTLTGDTVDGYPGCPGVGPVKAKAILDHNVDWPAIVDAFEAKNLTEADALVQARVARILRASDYNFKTKEVKLWQPSY
jgi:DNA polymerase-1